MTAPAALTAERHRIRSARRILVLGCPGSGKSTLAVRLARYTGLPLHHLDDEHWGPGWSRPTPEAWRLRQRELAAGDRWIIEGNYLPTVHLRAARAQLVIMLDTGTLRCLARVLRRAWRIRRGDPAGLPLRVREQARAGERVSATRGFLPLLVMVATFRARRWWTTLRRARAAPGTPLLVAVGPGRTARRTAVLRARLHRAGVPALVAPATDVCRTFQPDAKGHQ
jgi:adenylate kinase family enzyme